MYVFETGLHSSIWAQCHDIVIMTGSSRKLPQHPTPSVKQAETATLDYVIQVAPLKQSTLHCLFSSVIFIISP